MRLLVFFIITVPVSMVQALLCFLTNLMLQSLSRLEKCYLELCFDLNLSADDCFIFGALCFRDCAVGFLAPPLPAAKVRRSDDIPNKLAKARAAQGTLAAWIPRRFLFEP
jgi:hypothetical protein